MTLEFLTNKRILILGFGREGQDSFLFLRRHFPEKTIGIADQTEFQNLSEATRKLLEKDKHVVLYFGDDYLSSIYLYEVVIKSPGIPLHEVQPFVSKTQQLTSQTNIFFDLCPGRIIGVTGTKGKSTTSSLLYEVLKQGGFQAHLVGNIGVPVFQALESATKKDVFIYELSSYQLELLRKSPHIAILLNLYEEHLDHYGSMKSYVEAKSHIAKFQTDKDYLVYNRSNQLVRAIAKKSKAKKIAYEYAIRADAPFIAALEPVIEVGKLLKISQAKIQKAIRQFKPLPHRLEFVGTYREIKFYNDSLATIPEAAMAAISSLGSNVHTLIAGGFDRGVSMKKFAEYLLASPVRVLILFPITGISLWDEMQKLADRQTSTQLPEHVIVQTMDQAVQESYARTLSGNICLLSPAASSFNLFRDYQDRGEQFKKFVKFYGKKKS